MIFSSFLFLFIYLPFSLCIYYLAPGIKLKNLVLTILSLVFYAYGEVFYILVMLSSISLAWGFGILIENNHYNRKKILLIGIISILSILLYFKYTGFLSIIFNVNKFSPALYKYLTKIHLPLGISFYTFQSISYLVDIYLGEIRAQRNIIDFAMYKTFFPQLVAGPIVRYKDIIPYIKQRSFSWRVFSSGIDRFIYGLASKAILANSMGSIANDVFSVEKADLGFYEAWIGIICYSLQIYFDFSGYSSMAIGMAKMFGFEFKENFNYPYSAPSITDFWRRWHISLSSWFKDYIYIPLGGNRCSEIRKIVNLYVVFFLCGLWHGASWNFIVWGLWHGSLLVIEKFFIKFNSKIINYTPRFCSSIYVFLVVMIGWVFFRSDDLNQAVSYLGSMFFYKEILSFKFQLIMIKYFNFKYLLLFVISIAMLFPLKFHSYYLIQEDKSSLDCAMLSKITVKLALLIYSLLSLAGSSFNPFIYFRF